MQSNQTQQGRLELPVFTGLELQTAEQRFDRLLASSTKKIESLESVENPTWQNLVYELDLLGDEIGRFFSPLRHLNAVMNSDEIRQIYNACLPKLRAWHTDLEQNSTLFEKIVELSEHDEFAALSNAQKKSIENRILQFKLGGVALRGDEKKRFKVIALELSKLGTRFQENVLDATKAWTKNIPEKSVLAGFPESALASARQAAADENKQGYLMTLDFPSYYSVMTFADDRTLREEVYFAYVTRASDQSFPSRPEWDNAPLIERIIELRCEKAQLLGFENYAEWSVASKMVKSPDQVLEFLDDLALNAKPSALRDYQQLGEFAQQEYGLASIEPWDILYFSNKLKKKLFNFSEEDLKPYFPANVAIPGLFKVVGKLFGIKVEKIEDADVWHKDVSLYKISDRDGVQRGAFYMDNYARSNKRGGAWMDACVGRMKKQTNLQLPVAFLTCNLTPPVGDEPALLTHSELTTLFHEFGHGLHHMLTKVDYPSVAGINGVEWDAVELPSQFLENWCWERESLDMVSQHYKTAESLPQELLERARAARNFQSGMMTLRQVEFALFDMRLHQRVDSPGFSEIQNLLTEIRSAVAVYKTPEKVRFQNGFAHIFAGGYAAGYFSYKWAEVLSCDAFSRFEEEGIFNAATGNDFLTCIIEKGGTEKALDLFVSFRGREPEAEALLRQSGLAA